MNNYCIVTTINKPTKAIEKLHEYFGDNLIIVGDEKTPKDWNYKGIVPMQESEKLYAPKNHYARKNLGYLNAIKNKAELIYDTDDDNIPNKNWIFREEKVNSFVSDNEGWFNVYNIFTDYETIWPRGFSLKHWRDNTQRSFSKKLNNSSIQQGMVDGDPDVDAIWRLSIKYKIPFCKFIDVYLLPKAWCPFNSQSTWWFRKAFPLMYLPVNTSFRMTDIWRSFIAQKCLWAIGEGVTFHSPSEVYQDRNEHDLIKDLEDEIIGYRYNDRIVEILSELKLKSGEEFMCENLLTCYEELVEKNIFKKEEILSVKEWIKDYENVV